MEKKKSIDEIYKSLKDADVLRGFIVDYRKFTGRYEETADERFPNFMNVFVEGDEKNGSN